MKNKASLACVLCVSVLIGACGGGSDSAVDNNGTDPQTGDANSGNSGNNGGSNAGNNGGTNGGTSGGTSGGTNNGDSNDPGVAPVGGGNGLQLFGAVNVSDNSNGELDLSAGFFRFNTTFPASAITPVVQASDTCEVVDQSMQPPPASGPQIPNVGSLPVSVSAGSAISFSSATGSFATLPRQVQFGQTIYQMNNPVSGPAPDGMSFTIPGDIFPAFSNVPVPPIDPMQWIAPAAGQSITPQSILTWQAGSNPDARVTLSFLSFDLNNPQGGAKLVDCDLIDDGTHTFSAATQSAMGASFSAAAPPSASRSVTTVQIRGNAVLMVERD